MTSRRLATLQRHAMHASRRLATLQRHLTTTSSPLGEKVCVLGAGSFGSAITRVLSQSPSTTHVNLFARRSSLSKEINTLRTNRQYIEATGEIFPPKVTAYSSLSDSITGATMLVVVVPSNYLEPLLIDIQRLRHLLGENPIVVSLVKSLHYDSSSGRLKTICEEITHHLGDSTPVLALMGPNIYTEMIRDTFAEATIGYLPTDLDAAARTQRCFTTDTFCTSCCEDRLGVELAGGLKNVVSLGAGFCEGLGQGANARAAICRLGLREMASLSERMGAKRSTLYEESSGMGDLVLTCTVGRGRQLACSFVHTFVQEGPCLNLNDSLLRWERLEHEKMNGMKIPDYHNASVVHDYMLSSCGENFMNEFPLFTTIYNIAYLGAPPSSILDALRMSASKSPADY